MKFSQEKSWNTKTREVDILDEKSTKIFSKHNNKMKNDSTYCNKT